VRRLCANSAPGIDPTTYVRKMFNLNADGTDMPTGSEYVRSLG